MTSPEDLQKAQQFQRFGDWLTDARYHLALPVSALVAFTEPSSRAGRVATALSGAVWSTDTFDGKSIRKAQSLAELPPTDGPERDPEADKRLAYGLAGAIVIRAIRTRDLETAIVMTINTGVSYLRDRQMRNLREDAKGKDLPVDAIPINKNKTTTQAISSVGLVSELTTTEHAKRALLTSYTAGTILGVIGMNQYKKQIKEDDEPKLSIIPDHETDNLKHINIDWMTDHGYKALSIDVDNTIMSHHGKEIDSEILMSLQLLADMGVPIAFASNAYGDRANELKEIAKSIHENVIVVTPADVSDGKHRDQHFRKPKPDMIIEIANRLGVKPEELLHAGDQQFKDVLSANRAGAGSLLVHKFGEGGDWRVELLQRPVEKLAMGIIRAIKLRSTPII